jgi:multidrug resistance efflux pump
MDQRSPAETLPRRAGIARRAVLLALSFVAVAAASLAYSVLPGLSRTSVEETPLMHRVERGDFVHDITERGNVESASNIEVRCEVQSQNTAGTRILKIVPEGTYVQKGDVICELDSSALENDRMKQESIASLSFAALIQAENDVETAKIAEKEYQEGKYKLDEQAIQSEIQLAEETQRRAEDYLKFSRDLAQRGYITQVQLQADQFASAKAKTDLASAKKKLDVLKDFTKAKMLLQLASDKKTAEAKHKAQQATHELDDSRLKLIKSQIEKCIVRAPENGQVVYATNTEMRGFGNEVIIEEGALVRERQVIVRLPDPKRMQVKAKVNESKIALVRKEQAATIRLDAFPDVELTGVVEKVSEYPAASSWWVANVKEYDTIVRIVDSPVMLRPGLNAEVNIRVDEKADVLQAPVQAVFEHSGKFYCAMRSGSDWEAREIEVGATNDKFVVVEKGLEAGDLVAMNAAALREKLNLPEVSRESVAKTALAGVPSTDPSPAKAPKPKEAVPPDDRDAYRRSFDLADKNHDGKLDRGELPERYASMLQSLDTNRDGKIDLAEWTAAERRFAEKRDVKPRPPAAPAGSAGGGP